MIYSELAKAKLSALVVSTTAAGYIAAGEPIHWPTLAACLVGTAACSSSAAALNQILERDRDARMKRTQNRPLVQGHLTVGAATCQAVAWGVGGTAILAAGTDPVTTALGVGNIGLYAGLYTYLKPRSVSNTWVGAVVGAIPPVMGWTAAASASGDAMSLLQHPNIDTAILLGTTLYLWQMPHFFALSYMHRVDYKRGGFCMLPCEDEARAAAVMVRYAWYLSAVPLVATAWQSVSSMFCLEGLVLNGYSLAVVHRFERERTNANARKVFLTSLWYLPCWMILFLLHSKIWDEDRDDVVLNWVRAGVFDIRQRGRELCLHEAAAARNSKAPEVACPVVLTQRQTKRTVDQVEAATNESTTVVTKRES